jgi:hypothetical protein
MSSYIPVYEHIERSKITRAKKKGDDTDPCNCEDGTGVSCGEGCILRALKTECDAQSCKLGVSCENQRFSQRLYADVKVMNTEGKGIYSFVYLSLFR